VATVLIVEDNEPSRDALARRLERRGYTALMAVDGTQGVSLARSAKPDLILMDLGCRDRRVGSDQSPEERP
jgi:DNA-binding response OmpR family regulator